MLHSEINKSLHWVIISAWLESTKIVSRWPSMDCKDNNKENKIKISLSSVYSWKDSEILLHDENIINFDGIIMISSTELVTYQE